MCFYCLPYLVDVERATDPTLKGDNCVARQIVLICIYDAGDIDPGEAGFKYYFGNIYMIEVT